MLGLRMIRAVLFAAAVLFGIVGTLCLYLGLTARPGLNVYAVVSLGAAAVIGWSLHQSG